MNLRLVISVTYFAVGSLAIAYALTGQLLSFVPHIIGFAVAVLVVLTVVMHIREHRQFRREVEDATAGKSTGIQLLPTPEVDYDEPATRPSPEGGDR